MNDHNGTLALLQDLKDLLWGIFLLILGIFLCAIGIFLGGWGSLLLIPGIFVTLAGILYAHHGYTRHEVVEREDGP
nr:hypothetical protein [uncultured Dysosmobacter sp.]